MGVNDSLKDLFLIDQQVRGLEGRLTSARNHVRAQQTKLDKFTAEHAKLQQQRKQLKATEANHETEISGFEQRIAKLREQMNSAKTNKEYSATLVEVNTIKADKSKIEEKALELLTQIEQVEAQIAEIEAKITEQTKIKEMADRDLAERQTEVGEQLDELKGQRAEAATHVPSDALVVFEKLADALDGEAMAPVIQEDPRLMEYICGGCYMQIPMERLNQLITQDDIVRCPSCSRILYLEQELKTSMGIK